MACGVATGQRGSHAVRELQRLDGDVLRRLLGLGRLHRIGQEFRHLVLQRPLLGGVDLEQPLDPVGKRLRRRPRSAPQSAASAAACGEMLGS